MARLNLIALVIMLGAAGIADAQADAPKFVLTETALKRIGQSEQSVRIGEKISLKMLGRRFSDAKVSAEYGQGDDEYQYFVIQHEQSQIELFYDDQSKITGMKTSTGGVSDAKAAQVGESVSDALGESAYCNSHREDEMPYCRRGENKGLKYEIKDDEACKLPDGKHGIFIIPKCLQILSISTGG